MVQAALMLILLFLLPGWATWLAWGKRLWEQVTTVETLFLIVITSTVQVSWVGLLLAEFSAFSLPRLLIIIGVISLALIGWAAYRRELHFSRPRLQIALPAVLALFLLQPLILQGRRPFPYIVGGRDHGIYVNTGIHIARSGGILIHDPELATVPASNKPLLVNTAVSVEQHGLPGPWSEGQRLPGLTIRSLEDGVIAPHAFHLYPIWIAIFFGVGGLDTALAATAVFGVLGAFAVYMAAARLWGRLAALLGLLFLVVNVAQGWFVRYPAAEILVQFLFWSGLFVLVLMLQTDDRYAGVLAGGSLGLMHLTKLDTVVIPVAVFILLLYLWLSGRFRRSAWYFVAVYSILLLHTLWHAFFIATIYFLDQATRELLPGFLARRVVEAAAGYPQPAVILARLWASSSWLVLLGLAMGGTAVFTLRRIHPAVEQRLRRWEKRAEIGQGALAGGLALGIVATAVAGLVGPPELMAGTRQGFRYMGWYLTPVGFIVALIGLLHLVSAAGRRGNGVPLLAAGLLVTGNALPLFLLGGGTALDHFWAIRRFVPVVIPFFCLCIGYLLWDFVPRQWQNWHRAWLPLGLGTVALVGSWQQTRPFFDVVEYNSLPQQLAVWANTMPEQAVIMFEQSDPASRLALPLWFIHDKSVFMLPAEKLTAPELAPALESWQAADRPIYWVATGGVSPPAPPDWVADYETTWTIDVPFVETPRNRLPERVGEYVFTLDVHRILPVAEVERPQHLATIDAEEGRITGVYEAPQWPGLTTRTWTSGQVTVSLPPTSAATEKMILMLGNGRPADVPAPEIDIYWQNVFLNRITVENYRQKFEIPLPSTAHIEDAGSKLRLETDSWVPAQTGHGGDERELGVYLDWIKLVKTTQ